MEAITAKSVDEQYAKTQSVLGQLYSQREDLDKQIAAHRELIAILKAQYHTLVHNEQVTVPADPLQSPPSNVTALPTKDGPKNGK